MKRHSDGSALRVQTVPRSGFTRLVEGNSRPSRERKDQPDNGEFFRRPMPHPQVRAYPESIVPLLT